MRIPQLLTHPKFELEVVLVEQELIREYAGTLRRGRGGWRTLERRLLSLQSCHRFRGALDLWGLLQREVVEPFGTAELALALGSTRSVAQKFAYCMKAVGEIEVIGKSGNSLLYKRVRAGSARQRRSA